MKTQAQGIKDLVFSKFCQCFTWSFWVENDRSIIWSVGPIPTYRNKLSSRQKWLLKPKWPLKCDCKATVQMGASRLLLSWQMLTVFQELNVAPMRLVSSLAEERCCAVWMHTMRRIMGTTKPTVREAPFPSLSSVPSIEHYTAAKKASWWGSGDVPSYSTPKVLFPFSPGITGVRLVTGETVWRGLCGQLHSGTWGNPVQLQVAEDATLPLQSCLSEGPPELHIPHTTYWITKVLVIYVSSFLNFLNKDAYTFISISLLLCFIFCPFIAQFKYLL